MKGKINEINEGILWEMMKSGDQNSFSKIFKFYYPKLYAYGFKLVPLSDFVSDQIQELFIKIWQTKEGLGDVSNLKAYLFISLRRRLFASKKDRLYTAPIDNISEEDSKALIFEPNEFIDKEIISDNIKGKLIKNLNSLPVSQREIIFLRFYHQLTYKEIAEIINIKEQSVKNNMPKILQKLSAGITDIPKEDIDDIDIMLFNLFLLFIKK
ncbi:RNA polymerase sigma factor [Maribellus maritimus]|uniref:RNA polymerase sigma factor n=1 Tax=Maribellus maritimus TaxID=2870838 RepID=UPI001EEB9824|nr:RNA polymerase sigma factor [Maribellus maritimus]MCG6190866.1 RNA polymerase sigma factor [Maribellus maritimus]